MLLVGYMRVSKADGSQVLDLQRDALLREGVLPQYLYADYASGRREDRPGLDACLKALQPGNTLLLWRLDRLGRSLRHLVNTVHTLTAQGVAIKILTGEGAHIDTTTAMGKMMFSMFAALAEFEADLIRERTVAGLAAARARGRVGGRPRKVTREKLRQAAAMMAAPDHNAAAVARLIGINRTVLYRYVTGQGTLTPLGQALLYGREEALEAAD